MVVNVGAYATEIVRAGIESVPRAHIEAGRALGLKPWQIFRFIVLVPALRAVFPALGSQFILIMLASSVVSVISAEELTAVTDMIVARNFRSFEFYLVATGMYLVMALGIPGGLRADRPLAVRARGAGRRDPRIHAQRILVPAAGDALDRRARGRRLRRRQSLRAHHRAHADREVAPARAQCAMAYIKVFQGTPLLMQLYLIYFGANMFGLRIEPWSAAAVAFTLYASAFLGEIWRGCIEAIPRGQWEGARALALALPRSASLRHPAAGDAHRGPADRRLPRAAAERHLARVDHRLRRAHARGQVVNNATFRPFTVYALVAVIYFTLCWPLSRLAGIWRSDSTAIGARRSTPGHRQS